ncbi:hNH endonuclease [Enterobacter sp. 37]|uniref:hNH endonuclease n=1 Tax=Enterobacter sp. 37 TaxID=3085083 RepID=UPI002FC94F99
MKPTYEELEQQLAESHRALRAETTAHENTQMQVEKLAAENAGLKDALECVINPDNQPEYHDQGMGCGVEDHGYQRDGYSACYYGWESAMERVYSEVIPDAIPETPATGAFLAEVRAQGVEMAACALDDVNQFNYANMLDDLAQKLRKGVQS